MDKLEVRNRMTARELVTRKQCILDFLPSKSGKVFFACGNVSGYISPAVQKRLETITLDEMQYAECKKPGLPDFDEKGESNWIPCLMVIGAKPKPVRSFGTELLVK